MFIAANRAYPNSSADFGRFFSFGFNFGSFLNFGEIHNFLRFEIFIAKGRVRRKINRRIGLDESADSVQRVAGGGHIFKDDGKFILKQGLVGVSHVAMNQIEFIARVDDDD